MIELKLGELVGKAPVVKKFMERELPVKAATKLKRFAMKAQPDLELFDKQRFEIFKKFGTPVEGKEDTYEIKEKEKQEQANVELSALADTDIKLEVEPVTEEDLGDIRVTAAELVALDKIIV